MDSFLGHRMGELEMRSVQEVAAVARQSGAIGARRASACVERIADQRVPRARKVDPHLVWSAGRDVHVEQRRVVATFDRVRHTVGGLSAR
jgi:hypothetical protein